LNFFRYRFVPTAISPRNLRGFSAFSTSCDVTSLTHFDYVFTDAFSSQNRSFFIRFTSIWGATIFHRFLIDFGIFLGGQNRLKIYANGQVTLQDGERGLSGGLWNVTLSRLAPWRRFKPLLGPFWGGPWAPLGPSLEHILYLFF